jgi:hypothetical protein
VSAPRRVEFPGFHQALAAAIVAWHRAKGTMMEAQMAVKEAERQLRVLSVNPEVTWQMEEAMNATHVYRCAREDCDRPVIPNWNAKDRTLCPEHETEEDERVKRVAMADVKVAS